MLFFGRCAWSVLVAALAVAAPVRGEEPAQARPGRLDDPFLQNLVGRWDVSRRIRGAVVRNTLEAEWVLQHRFVQIHMKDAADPPEYEALVLIGFDASTQRYVAHWCNSYGGQFSAVAYGKREGSAIDFVFQYPDGPFHNTFFWNQDSGSWRLLMESEGKDGRRTFFAEDTIQKKPPAQALVPRQLEPLAFLAGECDRNGPAGKLAPGDILKGQFEIAPPGKPDAFSPYLAWESRQAGSSGL